jgi:PAS domain S-box-containing protein
MDEYLLNEEQRVKSRLVDTALIVSALAGFPLMVASVIRANIFDNNLFLVSHILLYVLVLTVALFRKRIAFPIRAGSIILIIYTLAILDFIKTGFVSIGFIWLTTAVVMAVLFFNFKRGITILIIGLLLIAITYLLQQLGVLTYHIDYNEYAKAPIILVMRTFAYLVCSFLMIFSIKVIYKTLNEGNDLLKKQKNDLLTSTQRLKEEIEVRKQSEQHALDNEFKFRNIFELSTDPISIVGLDGKFIDFNNSFIDLLELPAHEIANANYLELIPEEHRDAVKKYNNQLENIPSRFELKYKRNDGQLRYLDITTTAISYAKQKAILAVFRDNTEKINRERTIFSAAIQAEEKERLRLSKELHDGLGPLLSTIRIYLDVLEKKPGDVEIQHRINTTLNESIKSVKEISNNLSPYILQNLGVVKAIRGFIDKITFNQQLEVEFESNIENRLAETIEIAVYRLITELLNNTLKHASAKRVNIKIVLEEQLLTVSYSDNGIGFDLEALKQRTSGIGLFNIKSRIEKLGGTITINTSIGKGFQLFAQININEID